MPAILLHNGPILRRFLSAQLLSLFLLLLIGMHAFGQSAYQTGFAYLRMNEVNSHAARHFLTHYSQATGVKWSRDNHYLIASFNAGGATARSYYKNNGNFVFCIKNYSGDALNGDLKSVILKKFPGCKIILVTELTNQEKQAFYINIKCSGYIKTLCCNDEGIEVTENIFDAGI